MSTNTSVTEPTSDAVVSSEPPTNGDNAVSNGVTLVSKTETLVDDSRVSGAETVAVMDKDEKVVGESIDIVVQDSVVEARVSGGKVGVLVNDSEVVLDDVVLSEPLSNRDVEAVNEVEIGGNSLGSKTETLTVDDCNGDGDMVVQDVTDDSRVVMNNSELVVHNSTSAEVVVSSEPVSDRDTGAVDTVKIRDDSVGSETEILTAKPSDDQNRDGGVIVQDAIDVTRVSKDEKGVVKVNVEKVNAVTIGDDPLSSDTETLTVKPSDDRNRDGDIVVQDTDDGYRDSRDEKGAVMENIENVSDQIEVDEEEKEGEFNVTDIVWAKVKDYPWWPGQIFDPSAATDKAKKFSNKKGLLVGYFGDQSFAWNKPSNIKPFRKNFSKLSKQSNSKPFLHAVNCVLDEVSRRVDFGLACSCLSKDVYDKVKSQVFVNSGIREEDSKIDGGDRFSTVSTFKPVKVVQSVQELARDHFDGFSRLEVLSVRTQLLAFFRWKGYYQLQSQDIVDGLDNKLEDESELPLTEENKVVEDKKLASLGKKVSSKKKKPDVSDSDDDSVPRKKEKTLTNVTPKGNSSGKRSKKDSSKKATVENNVIKEEDGIENLASIGKKVSSKKRKPDVCDSDNDSDSVPRKKERSSTNVSSKGNLSAKRSKKDPSKKATVEDTVIKEENGNEKPDSVRKKVYSRKRKPDVSDGDDSGQRKKERSLTKMTSKGSSSVKRSKNNNSKKATSMDNVKVENVNIGDDKKSPLSAPRKLFRIGDSICKIAKQISQSPTIFKKESEKPKNDDNSAKNGEPVEASQTEE